MSKKIALVGNVLWDMYNFRGDIIENLIKSGYDVTIIAPSNNIIEEKLVRLGAKYVPIKLNRKGTNIIADLVFLFSLVKIYNINKFDLIFHYTIKPNIYGSIASKISGVRSIAVITGLGYAFINNSIPSRIAKILYKQSLKCSKEVWFLNKSDRDVFIFSDLSKEEQSKIIPGEGINLNKFKPKQGIKKGEKLKFLMIARVLYDKGFKEYVEAAEIIQRKYKNIEFQLLGPIDTGNPSGVSKEEVMKLHNKKIINYLGVTSKVLDYLENSDCVVLPSYREGVSRVLLEAAAMEKPIVATTVPGCIEIVEDGFNGFLCEVKNEKSLSLALEKIIKLDEKEKERFGKNGRIKVKREMEINKIIKIYNETLNKYFLLNKNKKEKL